MYIYFIQHIYILYMHVCVYMHIHFMPVYTWHMYIYIYYVSWCIWYSTTTRIGGYTLTIIFQAFYCITWVPSNPGALQDPWLLDLKEKQAIAKQEEDGNAGNLEEACHSPTFSKAESHHRYKWSAEKRSEATLYTLHVWFQLLLLVFWGSSSVCEVFFFPLYSFKRTRVGN